jgi:phosphoserine phosphatase
MAYPPADEQIADLKTVLEISRRLAGSTELDPLLALIEKTALDVLDCERATVFIYDAKTEEFFSARATGVDAIRIPIDHGLVGASVSERRIVNVVDAYEDPRFNQELDRKTGYRTQTVLCVPLFGLDDRLIGVLQFLNSLEGPFDGYDELLAKTLAAQVGVILQRQVLLDIYAEKQKMEHDMGLAREIQQALIPPEAPKVAGFDIAGWNRPADQTGGDTYDFLSLDHDLLAITVADATGHGIGPSLVATECRALMRAMALLTSQLTGEKMDLAGSTLPRMLAQVNDLLCADLPPDRFVTQFFGIIDLPHRRLSYVSAGHGPILLYRTGRDEVIDLPISGLALGMLTGIGYDLVDPVIFEPGDILIVVTDGFFEWTRQDGEMYGSDRIIDLVRANSHLTSAELIQALYRSVKEFGPGVPQADDLTAVFVRCLE